MNQMTRKTLVIIPAYNERGKIEKVVSKIPPLARDAILVIDDCSSDGTAMEARAAGAIVISHKQNKGVGAAIRTGMDFALENGYDIVAVLSGDDQHDPSDLPGLLAPVMEGSFDFVQGSRRLDGLCAPNIGFFRRTSTWIYTCIFRFLSGFPCTDATNGARAFRTSILLDKRMHLWQDWLNTYELEPYFLYSAIRCGYRVTEAPMKVIYHHQGTTKMRPVLDWWRLLRPLIFLKLGLRK